MNECEYHTFQSLFLLTVLAECWLTECKLSIFVCFLPREMTSEDLNLREKAPKGLHGPDKVHPKVKALVLLCTIFNIIYE